MTKSLIHSFATARSNSPDANLVSATAWNNDHTFLLGINAQTGTTYTVANSDAWTLVTFSNAASIAVTLPQAGSGGSFASGWVGFFKNNGPGATTFTPTTSTINGDATLSLGQRQDALIFSDGTNYFAFPLNRIDTPTAGNNIIVNGAMDVSQENGTTSKTLTNNTAKYILDLVAAKYNHGAATAVVTSAQLPAASFPSALPGFQNAHQIKATTAITSPASGDYAKHVALIEGYRIAHLGWGTASAQTIFLAFQYYSTASGTAFVRISDGVQARVYYHEIAVAAGWNFYAFVIPGDTSGSWPATTNIGLTIEVFSSGKETTPQSALDVWTNIFKNQTTNSTNLLATNNNQTLFTGVYIGAGSQLPVASDLPWLMRPFQVELDLAKPQYEKSYDYGTAPGASGATAGQQQTPTTATVPNFTPYGTYPEQVQKRVDPTVTVYSASNGTAGVVNQNDGTDLGAGSGTANTPGMNFFTVRNESGGPITPGGGLSAVFFHYVADARPSLGSI